MRFHALVRELGGSDGVRSEQMLASSVFQAQQSAFGEDAYATVPEKAAAYAFFLIQNHPFIDANKRTAELTMMAFFDLNGYKFVEDGLVHCRDTNGSPRGSSQDWSPLGRDHLCVGRRQIRIRILGMLAA